MFRATSQLTVLPFGLFVLPGFRVGLLGFVNVWTCFAAVGLGFGMWPLFDL